ncbi:MAG: TIM barrel protein [Methanocellales archaeon]|nr:TIM barrel protein [Methanocellales archaeon]
MIQVGIAGIPVAKKGKGMEEGVQYLSEIGLDAMEIQFVRGVFMNSETAEKVSRLAEKLGIRLSVHAPYYINLASNEIATIEKSKKHIIKSIKRAKEAGADIVVIHPAYYSNDTFELVRSACEEVLSVVGNTVKIGLETAGRQRQFGTVDEIVDLVATVKGTVPVLDFAHIHARGSGSLNGKEDYEAVFDKFEGNKFHIHFTGVKYVKGNEIKHTSINDDPNFKHLAEVLIERKYDATVICESPLLESDALKMKEIIANVQ